MMIDQFSNMNLRIYSFLERKSNSTWSIEPGIGKYNNLTYVVTGNLIYIINGIEYIIEKGSILYIPKGCLKEGYTVGNETFRCYTTLFLYEFFDEEYKHLPFPIVFPIGIDYDLLSLYAELNTMWVEKDTEYLLKCRALFTLIIHRLLIYASKGFITPTNKKIDKITEYIIQHFNEPLDVKIMSKLINIHPGYLGVLFKKNTGYTVKEYINRVRIHKAKDLLSTCEYRVNEVAFMCGFENIYYFSRWFKSILGMPPSDLIK